jgi:hypothetical protein
MARMSTAVAILLQHPLLSSVGARACQPGQLLEAEEQTGRRCADTVGTPGNRW